MASPTDIIAALEAPAALFAADGERLAANVAFESAALAWEAFGDLADGGQLESGEGEARLGWTVRRLTDGTRLVTGKAIEAPSQTYRQFVGALSHEFRTPLNGVLGMAGLLAETRLASDQKAYLASLRDCGEHLLGLVNDVLDLVRLEAGQVTLHPQPIDVRGLLQSTCELLSPRAHAKGLEIAWSVPEALPTVLADGGRLRQILFNLAGNAIKFTETGGALLSAEVREDAPASDGRMRIRFLVSDTGPGVPADQRERIFEAFAQADARHAARTDSSGLGLAIVRRLAAAHDGAAGLDDAAQGARFWFEARFPIVKAADPARALTDRTVTVVSPSPIVRHAASAIIEAAGGRAIVCDSIPAARGQAPLKGAVLLDHALAAAPGRTRARLRPLAGRASIILLAPEDRGHMAAYRAAGFAGYLIKPLRDVSLIERVLAALDGADDKIAAADERASPAAVGVRVLLVEDNPINALLARSLLEREGCAVDHAASGEEALAAASTSDYHLILMDQRLPGLDGRATTQALRARGCRAPIIALTADAFEEDRRDCLSAGMDDFLTKPLQPSALRPMLRRWTGPGWTRDGGEAKFAS